MGRDDMTPEELDDFMQRHGLESRTISDLLNGDLDGRAVRRWVRNARPIPAVAGAWLEAFAAWLDANPAPDIYGVGRDPGGNTEAF